MLQNVWAVAPRCFDTNIRILYVGNVEIVAQKNFRELGEDFDFEKTEDKLSKVRSDFERKKAWQ